MLIPSLAALNDHAALGVEQIIDENHAQTLEHALLDRRYTKPCARFMNGVRVGFGFSLERTCRSHSCKEEGCDSTAESLMHRSCRITDFKRHQDVILRNKQAVQRDEARLDRVSGRGGTRLMLRKSTPMMALDPIISTFRYQSLAHYERLTPIIHQIRPHTTVCICRQRPLPISIPGGSKPFFASKFHKR
jgi:hypothetical protein